MGKEEEVVSPEQVPAKAEEKHPIAANLSQTGNDNTQIAYVQNYDGSVHQTFNVHMQQPWLASGGQVYIPPSINREYYNLFVVGVEEFDKPHFRIMRSRSLNGCMSDETRKKFDPPTPETISDIKRMPSLFMAENRNYGRADDDQVVIYGFVSDVKIYDNDIKIYHSGFATFEQQRINELLDELGLIGDDKFNELNRTHWAIKRVDLIQELKEAGVPIPDFKL